MWGSHVNMHSYAGESKVARMSSSSIEICRKHQQVLFCFWPVILVQDACLPITLKFLVSAFDALFTTRIVLAVRRSTHVEYERKFCLRLVRTKLPLHKIFMSSISSYLEGDNFVVVIFSEL